MKSIVSLACSRAGRWILLAALVAPLPAEVSAQTAPDTTKCINAVNAGIRKVALAAGKDLRACADRVSDGVVATLGECLSSSWTIQKATTTAVIKADLACNGFPPAFGPPSVTTHAGQAGQLASQLGQEYFGAVPEIALNGDPAATRCQAEILKLTQKCQDVRLNQFNKCKKSGLQRGFVTNEAELQEACFGVDEVQPDPTGGKIQKTCVDKPLSKLPTKCAGVSLATAFPGCNVTTTEGLAACMDASIKCRVCNLLNSADGLLRDCDVFDDGNDANQSCAEPVGCGDGDIDGAEQCDDGNTTPGDGCNGSCQTESGWQCSGEPTSCAPVCGDGLIRGGEQCDDDDTSSGDGCSATCEVEPGYSCGGQPSVCAAGCGDGLIRGTEGCDDGDTDSGDGCSASCQLEAGWLCSGEPTSCAPVCGDGLIRGSEQCDDDDTDSGDGCSATCQFESGWSCSGQPTVCTTICGDGAVLGTEGCDDGGNAFNDGCSGTCVVEPGWQCSGEPSACDPICGDGMRRGSEACDDGDASSGDGCASDCTIEPGWQCVGQPSNCVAICGDGLVTGPEGCDDGSIASGDGCSATCQVETGWQCDGEPSECDAICGDGLLRDGEDCDDGDTSVGDGCSPSCEVEPGYVCSGQPSNCQAFTITITSPQHGIFTNASSINVTGFISNISPSIAFVTINGSAVSVTGAGTFSTSVPLNAVEIFNPIRGQVTDLINGGAAHDRVVVHRGSSIADGAFSPQSIGLRMTDGGLDAVEPLVQQLAGGGLNLADLLPVGTVLVDNECFIDTALGCLGRGTVSVISPAPSISGFGLNADSMTNFVAGDITVNGIRVNVHLSGSGLVPSCDIHLQAAAAFLNGDYTLEPFVSDPTNIDVNQLGALDVSFSGFNVDYDDICDAPVIGDIIQAFMPDVEDLTVGAMATFLSDPDGGGPLDSPTANAIETALEGISISGPVGEGLGVDFDSPLFQVAEDNNGITFGSNGRFTVVIGTDPGECIPPAGAPNLTASYAVSEVFPSYGTTTPVLGQPYDIAISISTEGFNQLLRAQTECGLLVTSVTSLDLGSGPVSITAGLLALFLPEFAVFPPATPFRIDIRPTLAPILSATAGPNGEFALLRLSHLLVTIVQDDASQAIALRGAVDAKIGLNLTFASGSLNFLLGTPDPEDVKVAVILNPLGVNVFALENDILPPLVTQLLPSLAGGLGSFPLPEFLGLTLQGVEISRQGEFLSLYTNLN